MPGQRPILAMSFIASLGLTFQVLACNVPKGHSNYWPMLVYIFYVLLPLPILISTRIINETMVGQIEKDAAKTKHYAVFFTAGILVSSFALPIVLTRSPTETPLINPTSCLLVEIGNMLCYTTMALFCIYFKPMAT